jgi:xylan 1,4-beta-xylosidase
VDNDLRTWWQPDANDKAPSLTSSLAGNATVHAIRIAWRDLGLNTQKGITPGPFRYKVELQTAPNIWTTVIDRSQSKDDFLIDYRECPPTKASAAKLVIVSAPAGITPGVAEFTVFGTTAKPTN